MGRIDGFVCLCRKKKIRENEYMIPKIIHYCWFGDADKPAMVKFCIRSWRKFCPDFEIKEWNESNFNVNQYEFTKQAYACKKYAFVADVARLQALVNEGGVYLDTDVFLIKPLSESLLERSAIVGFEQDGLCLGTAFMACEPNHVAFEEFLDVYRRKRFVLDSGELNMTPNVIYFTDELNSFGLLMNDCLQRVHDVDVFPSIYFSPMIPKKNIRNLNIKRVTVCVHLFYASWNKCSLIRKMKIFVSRFVQIIQLLRYI